MISPERKVLVDRLGRREFWGELFGWMVGVGLVVEYWQEIVDCFTKRQLPPLPLVGGLVVTLGVLGEVWFSRLASKTAEEISERADSDVAQANKRAADALEAVSRADLNIAELNTETERLRNETAEANLARAKIAEKLKELSSKADLLNETVLENLKVALVPHKGTRVDVFCFDGHFSEVFQQADQINFVLVASGLNSKLWSSTGRRLPGLGVVLGVSNGNIELQRLAGLISKELYTSARIESSLLVGPFEPINLDELRGYSKWDPEDVAVLRIQVGEKQPRRIVE